MTGDRPDERKQAAMDFSTTEVAQTPSWLVWTLIVMPVCQFFSSFLFVNTKLYILHECLLCLIFITIGKLAIKLSVKSFKTRISRYNNINYGAWHVYKSLFGSSVAISGSLLPKCRFQWMKNRKKEQKLGKVRETVGHSTIWQMAWQLKRSCFKFYTLIEHAVSTSARYIRTLL